MSQSRPNIKAYIRTGQFSKRLNLLGGQSSTPATAAPSTVPAKEDDSKGKAADSDKDESSEKSTQTGDLLFLLPDEVPSSTRSSVTTVFSSIPSIISTISSGRKSHASSRNSRSSRSELPTIKEVPQSPDLLQFEPSLPAQDFSQYHAIPLLPPPPGFQPVIQSQVPNGKESQYTQYPQSQSLLPPTSPPQAAHSFSEKSTPSSTGSWPLPKGTNDGSRSPFIPNMPMQDGIPPGNFVPVAYRFETPLPSRFSWQEMTKTQKFRNFFTRWFVEWWLMEILSWAFSAICMTIILIVLLKYNGKGLPKWKMGLTLNAFISIFSGFAKSALLLPTAEALGQLKWNWFKREERKMMDFEILDSASRGPWGSFVLLARTKGITLASVGAAIILLSFPLDLFFQQIVSYPTVPFQSSNATILRSVVYNPQGAKSIFNNTVSSGPDPPMDGPVQPFWFGEGYVPSIAADCQTSNCTFDPFYSLAVCSSCKENPITLNLRCQNASADWLTNSTPLPKNNPNITSCGWFLDLPNQLPKLMTGYSLQPNGLQGEAMSMRMVPLRDLWTRDAIVSGGSISFKQTRNTIADFLIAALPDGFQGAYSNSTPAVHECEVHWCVKKLQSGLYNGSLKEETLEILELDSPDLGDQTWQYELGVTSGATIYNPSFNLSLPDAQAEGGVSHFGLSNSTARKTIQMWDEILPSTVTGVTVSAKPRFKWNWRFSPVKAFEISPAVNPWLPNKNISQHLQNITDTMSAILRQARNADDGTLQYVQGQGWSQHTLVKIRWIWITLPVGLLAFSFVFLVATVIRSSKDEDKVGIWKTSALAVLFNGIGEDVQSNIGSNVRLGEARSKARDMTVKLEE